MCTRCIYIRAICRCMYIRAKKNTRAPCADVRPVRVCFVCGCASVICYICVRTGRTPAHSRTRTRTRTQPRAHATHELLRAGGGHGGTCALLLPLSHSSLPHRPRARSSRYLAGAKFVAGGLRGRLPGPCSVVGPPALARAHVCGSLRPSCVRMRALLFSPAY